MPRPPRRAEDAARRTADRTTAVAQLRHERTTHTSQDVQPHTTPTRITRTHDLTAAIPTSMLETPPHAPFVNTPLPPAGQHWDSSFEHVSYPARQARGQYHSTPVEPGTTPLPHDSRHFQSEPLGSPDTETAREDLLSLESPPHNAEDAKQLHGHRDISSLATWTLSSAKPGCALPQLRHPSPSQFWQSDGPQPHTLTLHFFKLVSIVKMRVYLDFKLDESYTPTKMSFFAGMSEGALVEFSQWEVEESVDPETGEPTSTIENIRGWIDISLKGVGGHEPSYYEKQDARRALAYERRQRQTGNTHDDMDVDSEDEQDLIGGDVLRAMVVQVRICENHQNGKDTHVRGFQVFSKDEVSLRDSRKVVKRSKTKDKGVLEADESEVEMLGLQPARWMAEPEIR